MHQAQRSERLSTPKLFLIAGALFLISILAAIYPSTVYAKNVFIDVVFPIQKFDANTQTVLELPDAETRYVIAVAVTEPMGQAPPVDFEIDVDQGELDSSNPNGWISIMGHNYRSILIMSPTESQTVTITANADPGEDFVVYRVHTDTLNRRLAEALPWWITCSLPFLAGFVVILFIIFRIGFQTDDIKLEH